jgi:copper chaperone
VKTGTYSVPKIRCEGCATTITEALTVLEGVQDVDVDIAARKVAVTYDETETGDIRIRSALAGAGYPAD